MNKISFNGVVFTYSEIAPNAMITGKERLYFFSGISWKQLNREPKFKGLTYIDNIAVKPTGNSDPKAYIFWNGHWYKKQNLCL